MGWKPKVWRGTCCQLGPGWEHAAISSRQAASNTFCVAAASMAIATSSWLCSHQDACICPAQGFACWQAQLDTAANGRNVGDMFAGAPLPCWFLVCR